MCPSVGFGEGALKMGDTTLEQGIRAQAIPAAALVPSDACLTRSISVFYATLSVWPRTPRGWRSYVAFADITDENPSGLDHVPNQRIPLLKDDFYLALRTGSFLYRYDQSDVRASAWRCLAVIRSHLADTEREFVDDCVEAQVKGCLASPYIPTFPA